MAAPRLSCSAWPNRLRCWKVTPAEPPRSVENAALKPTTCRGRSVTSMVTGSWPWASSAVAARARTVAKTPSAARSCRGGLDLGGVERVVLVDQQAAADVGGVYAVEPADGDGTEVHAGAGVDMERDVERLGRGIERGGGGVDLGEGVAGVAEGFEQAALGGQHVGGAGGCAGFEQEGGAGLADGGVGRGRRALGILQGDAAELEQGAAGDGDRDVDGGRRGLDRVGQGGVVHVLAEALSGDADGDLGVVVAEAVERGLQPGGVVAGAGEQGEGADGGFLAQGDQAGGVVEHGVERGVAGGREGDGVGLGVCGVGRGGVVQGRRLREKCYQDGEAPEGARGDAGPGHGRGLTRPAGDGQSRLRQVRGWVASWVCHGSVVVASLFRRTRLARSGACKHRRAGCRPKA